MTFTPEDGTGIATANAYIAVAFYRTFHTDRGRVVNEKASVIEGAIVRATDYIDKRFGRMFRGYRESKLQGLEWPRLQAMDESGWPLEDVPKLLQRATAEYARTAINVGVIAPNPQSSVGPQALDGTVSAAATGEVIKEKMDVMETEYLPISRSRDMMFAGTLPELPEADLWINELIVGLNRILERG